MRNDVPRLSDSTVRVAISVLARARINVKPTPLADL